MSYTTIEIGNWRVGSDSTIKSARRGACSPRRFDSSAAVVADAAQVHSVSRGNGIRTLTCMREAALTLILAVCASTTSYAASYSCSGNLTNVESIICNNEQLSGLDDDLSTVYSICKRLQPELIRSQDEWLNRRNSCKIPDCIRSQYVERIAALEKGIDAYVNNIDEVKNDCESGTTLGMTVCAWEVYERRDALCDAASAVLLEVLAQSNLYAQNIDTSFEAQQAAWEKLRDADCSMWAAIGGSGGNSRSMWTLCCQTLATETRYRNIRTAIKCVHRNLLADEEEREFLELTACLRPLLERSSIPGCGED